MLCILYEIVLTFGVYLYYFVFNYVRRLEISLYQALLKNAVYYYYYYYYSCVGQVGHSPGISEILSPWVAS